MQICKQNCSGLGKLAKRDPGLTCSALDAIDDLLLVGKASTSSAPQG